MAKNRQIELSTIIGKGCTIEGNLKIQGGIRIDGSVTGEIDAEGFVVIGNSGSVKANIKAKECLVSGTLDGDIIVTDTLELEKTSKVNGNISAKRLTVHNGAALTGHCNMKEESKTSEW